MQNTRSKQIGAYIEVNQALDKKECEIPEYKRQTFRQKHFGGIKLVLRASLLHFRPSS